MPLSSEKVVNVIGHINPDTDSICSAIAYARLKREVTGENYVAKRAGQINAETRFVLKKFGVLPPDYMNDVRPQVIDIDVGRVKGVGEDISLKKAWELMREDALQTLPIVDESQYLKGLITIEDIAKSYMDVYDSRVIANAQTPFRNIVETLGGEMISGDSDETIKTGKCLIAAANPDLMESYIEKGDIVILGNRYESQLCAIEMGAKCIIVCDGAPVSFTITKLAQDKGCFIIKTPYDTFTASRLINQSIPIRFFMKSENLITFGLGEFLDDIRDVMAKKRYRDFPILDWNGKYFGMISRRRLLGARKKKLILVDHNEPSQAVDGIEDAELLEIIDHHRIGSIETMSPVFFRNQPLGCTATIIYQMYCEHNIDIDKTTAALLCSAIISDTLILKSPTCTHYDVDACQVLADIAGIDIEEYGREMFRAGSNLSDKSEEEIFYRDYKKFSIGEITVGVGQVNCMSQEEIEGLIKKEASYITSVTDKSDEINIAYLLLTDVMKETSYVMLSGKNAEQVLMQAFNLDEITNNYVILPGVVSRKKQFLPAIVEVLQQ